MGCLPRRVVLLLVCVSLAISLPAGMTQPPDKEELEKIRDRDLRKARLEKAEEEYRLYFKTPLKTHEFWAAIKLEIALGKFEVAGYHLSLMLKEDEKVLYPALIELEDVEGYYPFLRLQDIKKWSDYAPFQLEAKENVQVLLKHVTAAVEKHLSDPDRINKFIARLDAATKEERGYAFLQLAKSRQRAVPYLVETLRTNVGKPVREKVVQAYLEFDQDFMTPLLEILKANDAKDARDIDLRVTLLDIFRKRGERSCVPYLWHMSSSSMYPVIVREAARDTLAYFQRTDPTTLPKSKVVLVEMAEKFYQHRMKFEPGGQRLWKWDGQSLAAKPEVKETREAEEFYGLRYAREALDLDPSYKPAQMVFLNFILERTFDRSLDQFLLKPMPADIQQLLTSIDTELIQTVLERAMDENNLALILPTVQILGQRGELRAARTSGTQLQGLVRALYYPDRRVQFTAMNAVLRLPTTPTPLLAHRTVDLLRRFLISEPEPKALVACCPKDQAAAARTIMKEIGFESEVAGNVKEAIKILAKSADYDVIFLHSSMPAAELPYALAQLRGDRDAGRLALIVLAKKENLEAWTKFSSRHVNTWVVQDALFLVADELKILAEAKIKEASGAKLTADERKKFTRESMDYLWKMGRGEITGYDVRAAEDALEKALRVEEMSGAALETLARFPGRETQARLATLVLDPRFPKLKMPAVLELNRHIHKHGLQLDKNQLVNLRDAHAGAADNPDLRTQLALVLASLRITPQQTGARLFGFNPQPPAPQPPAPLPEKKDEK